MCNWKAAFRGGCLFPNLWVLPITKHLQAGLGEWRLLLGVIQSCMSVFGIGLMNQGLPWANCPSQIQTSLSPGSAVPPPFKAKLRFGVRNEIKPTRQRTTSHHFLLLSAEFPKLTMPSASTPVSQPWQSPTPTSQHLPGSELNSLQSLQEWCESRAWALIHGKPWDPSTVLWMQLSLEPFGEDLWGSTAALGHRCPTSGERSGWGHARAAQDRPAQLQLWGASSFQRHSGVTRKDQTASASWPFSSSFIISISILIVLNVGISDFLCQRKNQDYVVFLHLSLVSVKEISPAVSRKSGKARTLASHSSSFLVNVCCEDTHTTLKVGE